MRKKVDSRIRTLIENGVKTRHRSFFVIVGDNGKDQVVNLHYILSKTVVKARPSVLWTYKKDLGFSSHKKKRMKQIKKQVQRGLLDPEKDDPFELFISATNIRYCYYSESHKVLGQTFGMLVMQDFEALTPNLLARTIETVEGGGIVVLLLKSMRSLKQLYTMTMDVHNRFRTHARKDVVARFNERFLLSLGTCHDCLVVDDELNILPLSSHARGIKPIKMGDDSDDDEVGPRMTESERELADLKASLKDTQPVGSLVETCRTLDQAKAVLTFVEAISEKSLRSTVSLTASRGRGKSAALGIAIAGSIAYGYSNVFVTSPTPENLKTLFDFILKGFDALGFTEHTDYTLVQSTNPAFNKAIVRINIYREHRQTIQYIQPTDSEKLSQAELVVVDEAAAIPLPYVKKLLGNYLVFLSSTINGYEGTGRSLSLKLISQLRANSGVSSAGDQNDASSARVLKELKLAEPIRYSSGDRVESWLNELLCLDASIVPQKKTGCPHPSECELYMVNRDTLFSGHKASEAFLQRMMALYVASHYKNTPNDLQLMSDAPAHQLFVLLGPVDETQSTLPEILCVLQVCLEGAIARDTVLNSLSRGVKDSGDLIPWNVSQQFQDSDFASLSGARVVRIATHPDMAKMGYGTRALECLNAYFQGDITSLHEGGSDSSEDEGAPEMEEEDFGGLAQETIRPRRKLKEMLVKMSDCKPQPLHWSGVSFGLTPELYKFWRKSGYHPIYLRLTPNDVTGEHTMIMVKSLKTAEMEDSDAWLQAFTGDFKKRFVHLLGYQFRDFQTSISLSVLDPKNISSAAKDDSIDEGADPITQDMVEEKFSPYDLKRLDSYARNMIDYHQILDLLPEIARLLFLRKIPVTISYTQAAIFLGVGLQFKSIDDMEKELRLPSSQILALFNKIMRRVNTHFRGLEEEKEGATIADKREVNMQPVNSSLNAELAAGGKEASKELKRKQQELIASLGGDFAVGGNDEDWGEALKGGSVPGSISVKSKKKNKGDTRGDDIETPSKKQKKHHKKGKSPKH